MPSTIGIVSSGYRAPIDPLTLSPWVWFDASDSSTITSSTNLVSQWDDKSGNGRNLTSSGGSRPTTNSTTLNGKNVLTFSGSNVMKHTPGTPLDSDYTIFSLWKLNAATTYTMPGPTFTVSNVGRPMDRWQSTTENKFPINNTTDSSTNAFANLRTWTTWASWSVTYSKTSTSPRFQEFKNNVSLGTSSSGNGHVVTGQVFSIGQRDDGVTSLNGWIAEVFVFPSILNAIQRENIHYYFKYKWAI